MAKEEFNINNPSHYKFSSDPEKQKAYVLATNAIDYCRKGDIAQFAYVKAVVQTEPEFDNFGLSIDEKEFESLNANYELWRSQMNAIDEKP